MSALASACAIEVVRRGEVSSRRTQSSRGCDLAERLVGLREARNRRRRRASRVAPHVLPPLRSAWRGRAWATCLVPILAELPQLFEELLVSHAVELLADEINRRGVEFVQPA